MENKTNGLSDEALLRIRALAETIRYGTITLVFQDGKMVQIEKNEKMRLR